MDRIRIHTNWTNTVQEIYDFTLDDLIDGDAREGAVSLTRTALHTMRFGQ